MKYQIDRGSVSVDGKRILDHISFQIRGKDKIGIVGANGAGKTTLLHLIDGQLSLDKDEKDFTSGIWLARNTTIGILEQTPFFEKNLPVSEIIESASPVTDPFSRERYDFEVEYHKIFTMFGFQMSDLERPIQEFSGGEQTKIALIHLLLLKPDILMLDEPTNHLDLSMIRWLETYLKEYDKAVILVSHDRYFLDQVTDVIYEIDRGKMRRYAGNYSSYIRQREEEYRRSVKEYKKQQEEMEHLTKLIERFKHKPKKASMARSKKKMLERMDKIEPPDRYRSYIYAGEIHPFRAGSKWVYDLQKLQTGYDTVLQEFNLRIRRGQKLGIIGPNGSGKSTFLKTLAGRISPISGKIFPGTNLDIAYYDQFSSEADDESRVYEDFKKSFPSYEIRECRKILANYMFRQEDMAKKIKDLSGGEKSRYIMAKLLEKKPNVLLLDEPTNHLDIPSREILESAFSKYSGTVIFVTHDRYLLNQLADSLLIFGKDGVVYYPHSYADYVEAKKKDTSRRSQGIHTIDEENEALRQSLQAVPEKKRMQSSGYSSEQAFWDWQLDLVTRELEDISRRYGLQSEKAILYSWDPEGDTVRNYYDMLEVNPEELEERRKELKATEEKYTDCCIRWYDIWIQYEDAFHSYHD